MKVFVRLAKVRSRSFSTLLTVSLLSLVFSGCGQPNSSEPRGTAPPPVQQERGYGQSTSRNTSGRQQQAVFLNELRQADPSHQTIEKAMLNENNELALILNRNVDTDQIPALMRSVLTRMAREFPGQDLTVIAY